MSAVSGGTCYPVFILSLSSARTMLSAEVHWFPGRRRWHSRFPLFPFCDTALGVVTLCKEGCPHIHTCDAGSGKGLLSEGLRLTLPQDVPNLLRNGFLSAVH